MAEAVHASAFLFSQSALPYPLKTAEKRCFYTFTRIYKPLFGFIIGKIFSTFFEKNFYKMASLFPISEGVILARAPSGTLKTEYPVLRIFPLFSKRLAFCRQDLPTGSERSTERLNCRVVRLFAMMEKLGIMILPFPGCRGRLGAFLGGVRVP